MYLTIHLQGGLSGLPIIPEHLECTAWHENNAKCTAANARTFVIIQYAVALARSYLACVAWRSTTAIVYQGNNNISGERKLRYKAASDFYRSGGACNCYDMADHDTMCECDVAM